MKPVIELFTGIELLISRLQISFQISYADIYIRSVTNIATARINSDKHDSVCAYSCVCMSLGIPSRCGQRSYVRAPVTKIPYVFNCIANLVCKRDIKWNATGCIQRCAANGRLNFSTDACQVERDLNHSEITECKG